MSAVAVSPAQLADDRTRDIIKLARHARHLIIDSPPGAGKTGVVERLAIDAAFITHQRVMIAPQTNQQALDIARRIASTWSKQQFHLLVTKKLKLPRAIEAMVHDVDSNPMGNIHLLFNRKDVENVHGPCVMIANSSKWGYTEVLEANMFDLMIVEEAYQLRDSDFVQISGFARRHVLVGDPGQIAPVTTADTTRWAHEQVGPHTPAPIALLHNRPAETHVMQLPVSRRLPFDTVELVAPVFYPELPFQATSAANERGLLPGPARQNDDLDRLIDKAADGSTIVLGELPSQTTSEHDPALAAMIAKTVVRLLDRRTKTLDWSPEGIRETDLTPSQIGVVCAHRSQVAQISCTPMPKAGRSTTSSWRPPIGSRGWNDESCSFTTRCQAVSLLRTSIWTSGVCA
jgi:hypothetical protein